MESTLKQLTADNETLKQMVSTLKERAVRQDERSMEDIGYLSKILASRDEQVKKLRAEIETLKAENETLKSENAGLKEECDDWEAQYEEQLEIEEQEEEERQRESIASFKEKYCETDNDDDDDDDIPMYCKDKDGKYDADQHQYLFELSCGLSGE